MMCAFLVSAMSASQTDTLIASEDQLFWVNGTWIPASDLVPGDEFVTPDGRRAVVTDVQNTDLFVNDSCQGLVIEAPHDFFANGVLVHDGTARAFALNSAPADTSGPLVAFFSRLRTAIRRLSG